MREDRPRELGLWSDDAVDGLLRAAASQAKAQRPKQTRARATYAVLGLALSAATAMLVYRPRAPEPAYEVGAVLGGLAERRGHDETKTLRAAEDSQLSIRLRPSQARTAPPCRVYTRCGDETRAVPARVQAAEAGGLTVEGRAGDWFGSAPRRCEVWLGLGELDGVAGPPAQPGTGRDPQWLMVEVEYLGDLGTGHE